MVFISLALLVNSGLSQLATCNPQNRECSCADTSSRVSVFSFWKLCRKCFFLARRFKVANLNPGLWGLFPIREISCGRNWRLYGIVQGDQYLNKPIKIALWSVYLNIIKPLQALNPLGQCEWLLFHYSPAKGDKSFIPPYLNCEVKKDIKSLPLTLLFPAFCARWCKLWPICKHLR